MLFSGMCHCKNIAFELTWGGDPQAIPARACSCSFCVKHGALWTCHASSQLLVTIDEPKLLSRYAFGTKTAAFYVCARCGSVPLATSDIAGRRYAVVNVNTLHGIDQAWLSRASADFDGEDTATRLARRQRNWIAEVRFTHAEPAGLSLDPKEERQ